MHEITWALPRSLSNIFGMNVILIYTHGASTLGIHILMLTSARKRAQLRCRSQSPFQKQVLDFVYWKDPKMSGITLGGGTEYIL